MDNNRLPLGRYVVGNYYIEKTEVELTDDIMSKMTDNGVAGMVKAVYGEIGRLPYITIGDVSGLVRARYMPGTEVYNALDVLNSVDGEIIGEDCESAENFLAVMMCVFNTVGDEVYQKANMKNIEGYMERLGMAKGEEGGTVVD